MTTRTYDHEGQREAVVAAIGRAMRDIPHYLRGAPRRIGVLQLRRWFGGPPPWVQGRVGRIDGTIYYHGGRAEYVPPTGGDTRAAWVMYTDQSPAPSRQAPRR